MRYLYTIWYVLNFSQIPHFISILYAGYWMFRMNRNDLCVKKYLHKHYIIFLMVSMFIGFFDGIDLFRSKLFYKSVFRLQILSTEKDRILKLKFIMVTIARNLPQLVCNVYFIHDQLQLIYNYNCKIL